MPGLLDLIAPHSCRGCGHIGNVICNRCKNNMLKTHNNRCPICKQPNKNGICSKCKLPPAYNLGIRTGSLDVLIHELKYNSVRSAAAPLAELLDHSLPAFKSRTYIVPLPTIARHIRSRSLDHTSLIAKHLAKRRPNFCVSKLLLRSNNSIQVGSDAKTRIKQAKTAYSLNPKIKIDQTATYILFDDVWTTGASMQAAIDILKKADIKNINIATLAVSTI